MDTVQRTVVIVDDEPITRMDLSDMLAELHFTVAGEAADGFDAVELCRQTHPDVVLMDVKMPVFDGLTAAETILGEDLAGCVVLLTAFSDDEVVRRASRAGVTGYLVKPIDQKSLGPTIEVALAQSLRLRESRRQTRDALEQVQHDRQLHRAQSILARQEGCTETEAYRRMRRAAMDKRIPLAELAERILQQADRNDAVAAAKAALMQKKGYSEKRAYRAVTELAEARGLSREEAARQLLAQLERK